VRNPTIPYTRSMNRVDRLFGIILLLQHRRRVRAFDIAQRFEIGIRTVYRDVNALLESGVPIISIPGIGYELMEGYTLPPLAFSTDEAVGLFLSGKMLLAHTTGRTAKHTERAIERLALAMPKEVREQAESLTQAIGFFAPRARFDLGYPHLESLAAAIRDRRVVRFTYQALNQTDGIQRELEPEHLVYDQNAWYISGFCRLRHATRAFRLERLADLEILPETFSTRTVTTESQALITARIRVLPEARRWVLERQHYGFQSLEESEEGPVMTYAVKAISELVPWLLAWGVQAVPLEPAALRDAIRVEAQGMLEQLT
jgi:predicted DNA-binding transcriptional regulator YafY